MSGRVDWANDPAPTLWMLQLQAADVVRTYQGDDLRLLRIRDDPDTGANPAWSPTWSEIRRIFRLIEESLDPGCRGH